MVAYGIAQGGEGGRKAGSAGSDQQNVERSETQP